MNDQNKSKTQLIREIRFLRKKIKSIKLSDKVTDLNKKKRGDTTNSRKRDKSIIKSKQPEIKDDSIYRQLFELESDAVFLIDSKDGQILAANEAASQLYGYKKEELLKLKNIDLSDDPDEIRRVTELTPDTKENVVTIPFRYHKKKDGTVIQVEIVRRFFKWKSRSVHITAVRDATYRKNIEKQIQECKKELQWLLKSIVSAFGMFESVFDKAGRFVSGRFIYINDIFEQITGVKSYEVQGHTIHEIWPGIEVGWIRNFGKVAVTGKSKSFNKYHSPTNKTYFCNVYRPWNSPERFCVVFQDISERERAETILKESEKKYRQLFENAVIGLFQIRGDDDRFINVNTEFARILKYASPKTLIKSKKCIGNIFIHEQDYRRFKVQLKNTGYVKGIEAEISGKSRHRIWVSIYANTFTGSEGDEYCQGSFTDITIRRNGEMKIREGNVHLESLIEKRTMDLEKSRKAALSMMQDAKMEKQRAEEALKKLAASEKKLISAKQKAEKASQSKGEFVANMSHEIRTPIHAITGMIYLLNQTSLNIKQKEYTHKMEIASGNLLSIVNDILDFSKIEAGKLQLENTVFKLDQILDNAVSMNSIQSREKGLEIVINIEMQVPTMLIGDSVRLCQVLTNLVSNAVKFTNEGEIVIAVRFLEGYNGKVCLQFSVTDTGIGMSKKQIKSIFEPFVQADTSTTRRYGGSGLGLTISKKLVGMMGGSLKIESKMGKGTCIFFNLTFNQPDEQLLPVHMFSNKLKGILILPPNRYLQYSTQINKKIKNLNVLIVDDNHSTREAIINMLSPFSLEVIEASNGREAIELLSRIENEKKSPIDLILLDWKMHDLDGIETYKIIRNELNMRKIPECILMSAFEDMTFMEKAHTAKIYNIIEKPLSYSSLFNKIIHVFETDFKDYYKYDNNAYKADDSLRSLSGSHVMLVEDNEINQQVSRELLVNEGFRVTIAENGRDAFRKYSKNPEDYDLILMDIQMPIMDGYEAAKQIRIWEKTRFQLEGAWIKPIPIIAMTADVIDRSSQDCIDAGMNHYIRKPVEPKELYQSLLKWIPSRKKSNKSSINKSQLHSMNNRPLDLPSLNTIDVNDGLKRVNQNKKLYIKLLVQFYQKNQEFQKDLDQAVENDRETAIRLIHTLKGVSGNLAAKRLFKTAEKVEMALVDQMNIKKLRKEMTLLYESLNAVLNDLEKLDSQRSKFSNHAHHTEPINIKTVWPKIQKLAAYIEESNVESITLLEELLHVNIDSDWNSTMDQLYQLIYRYDFDEALGVLRRLVSVYNMKLFDDNNPRKI